MGLGAGACSAPLVALIEIGPGAGACVRRSSDGHSAAMPGTQTKEKPGTLLAIPPTVERTAGDHAFERLLVGRRS
jgi:hypothetical protein